ncbi:MAG: hypothetical protein IKK04_07080 [Bacteroidales bacterium]|nr:hypothetical protein [Bacteroidales bacterium]
MKKTIVISTSLRPGTNSHAMAEQFAKGLEAVVHQEELISLRDNEIKLCDGEGAPNEIDCRMHTN